MADSKNISITSDSTFDNDVLKNTNLAMVDFWAEWCGPCKMLTPTINAIASEFEGKLKVFKMNVDENPSTPGKFHIRGIPTVIFFKNGVVVDQLVGNQPKDAFVSVIERHS